MASLASAYPPRTMLQATCASDNAGAWDQCGAGGGCWYCCGPVGNVADASKTKPPARPAARPTAPRADGYTTGDPFLLDGMAQHVLELMPCRLVLLALTTLAGGYGAGDQVQHDGKA